MQDLNEESDTTNKTDVSSIERAKTTRQNTEFDGKTTVSRNIFLRMSKGSTVGNLDDIATTPDNISVPPHLSAAINSSTESINPTLREANLPEGRCSWSQE